MSKIVYSRYIDELGHAMLKVAVHKLAEQDYEALFRIQRSETYRDFFWSRGGSLPGFSFDSNTIFQTASDRDIGEEGFACSVFGSPDEDVSIIRAYPEIPYPPDPTSIDWGNVSGTTVSAMRYYGTAYMFVVEYAGDAAEGGYTIYLRRDASPETLEIIRLTAQGDVFTGPAVRETYADGGPVKTENTDEYAGIGVPVKGTRSTYDYKSVFWELQG
jgi:hypothetical protein